MLNGFFLGLGSYFLFLGTVLRRPESWREFGKSLMREIELLGLSSIPLVIFISLFMGAVLTIQTAINLDDPFIPDLFYRCGGPRRHCTGILAHHCILDFGG